MSTRTFVIDHLGKLRGAGVGIPAYQSAAVIRTTRNLLKTTDCYEEYTLKITPLDRCSFWTPHTITVFVSASTGTARQTFIDLCRIAGALPEDCLYVVVEPYDGEVHGVYRSYESASREADRCGGHFTIARVED